MTLGYSYRDDTYLSSNEVVLGLYDSGAASKSTGMKLGEGCLGKITVELYVQSVVDQSGLPLITKRSPSKRRTGEIAVVHS
jgi:hypothetical protein